MWSHDYFEKTLRRNGFRLIAGVDEVGRGALAGPVFAAAVVLDGTGDYSPIRDSKVLSARQRRSLAERIHAEALGVGFGRISESEIDRINILQATHQAMRQAVANLPVSPDMVLFFHPYPVNTSIVAANPLVHSGDELPVMFMNLWILDAWVQGLEPMFEEGNCAEYALDIREKTMMYETQDVDQFIVKANEKKMVVLTLMNVTEPCHLSGLRIVTDIPIRKFYSNYQYYAGFRRLGKLWETVFYLTETQ